MPKYKLSPRAIGKMRYIWRHIADRNEPADKFLHRLLEKLELVAEHPEIDVARPEIVVVVHGMRDPAPGWDSAALGEVFVPGIVRAAEFHNILTHISTCWRSTRSSSNH
ncbi:type II toxin-antitoxin system RelE/ParE family toxin [Rhizobium sp. BR 314]|uniref:type II toxin-antitoxin system RelE/ParE family toxin n=1 Tax=Rhizobium sp. BR 314 TaxID=3040013 RepID=UPI0039BF3210